MIDKLLLIHEVATDVYYSELMDEEKYDMIFSDKISVNVFKICKDLGSPLDYYDPDSSYDEDMKAFLNALDEKIKYFSKNENVLTQYNKLL